MWKMRRERSYPGVAGAAPAGASPAHQASSLPSYGSSVARPAVAIKSAGPGPKNRSQNLRGATYRTSREAPATRNGHRLVAGGTVHRRRLRAHRDASTHGSELRRLDDRALPVRAVPDSPRRVRRGRRPARTASGACCAACATTSSSPYGCRLRDSGRVGAARPSPAGTGILTRISRSLPASLRSPGCTRH
jgi:hypothetical protein